MFMRFQYKAYDKSGKEVLGTVESLDEKYAVNELVSRGLTPVQINRSKTSQVQQINTFLNKVTEDQVTNFTRQLSTMITAGLPIAGALSLLEEQSPASMRLMIKSIANDIQGGQPMSSALSKFPEAFSQIYIALVRAGEAAGVMDKILNRLADDMEENRDLKAKLVGAMVYPAIIIIGMVGVVFVMMVLVIPKLALVFKQFNRELPIMTRFAIFASDILVKFWWLILLLLGFGGYGLYQYIKTPIGKRYFDDFIYGVWIIGSLNKQIMLVGLTRTLSLLLSSGISIIEALKIVSRALGNVVAEKELNQIANRVEKGFPLSICFAESVLFPPIIGQMTAVGEETGKLDDILLKVSHYFESESEIRIKALTSAIEPLIMVILGVGVSFLVFTIILPIYDITNSNV
jgi:type IV pilus assembly protein PilC